MMYVMNNIISDADNEDCSIISYIKIQFESHSQKRMHFSFIAKTSRVFLTRMINHY